MATFRKIIQIAAGESQRNPESANDLAVVALCDDGSVWESVNYGAWSRWSIEAITQSPPPSHDNTAGDAK
jgi:hypothetical protein